MLLITDTSEFLDEYLTQPKFTSDDIMTHAIHLFSAALKDVPASLCNSQLAAIEAVRAIVAKHTTVEASPTARHTAAPYPPNPTVPLPNPPPIRHPSPTS